jgi:hypothetical protein
MGTGPDVKTPVVRINCRARIVQLTALNPLTAQGSMYAVKVEAILLHKLDIEAVVPSARHTSLRIEVPPDECCFLDRS